MRSKLKVSRTSFYLKLLRFALAILFFISCFFMFRLITSSNLIILTVLACFILPWCYIEALSEWDKNQKQFQSLRIKDEFLIFEFLPLELGPKEYVQIDFNNIKRIQVTLISIRILFVLKYEWKGEFCEHIMPSGHAPLLQEFSMGLNPSKRSRIKKFFESKELIDTNKISF